MPCQCVRPASRRALPAPVATPLASPRRHRRSAARRGRAPDSARRRSGSGSTAPAAADRQIAAPDGSSDRRGPRRRSARATAARRRRRSPRAARRLGRPVHRLARLVRRPHEIRRAHAHRRAMRRRMRGEDQAGVVGHVQPLVRVGRARVGALDAADVMAQSAARRRPQPERAVDVEPRPCRRGERRRSRRADRTRPVFTLPACAQTIVGPCRRDAARRRAHRASCAPDRRRRRAPPGASRCRASAARRCTDTCTSSPTTTRRRGAPCRPSASTSQPARRSSSWRAAASAVKFAMWQPVTKPTLAPAGSPSRSISQRAGHLLDDRCRGRHDVQAGVLIPRRGEPFGGDRRRQRAAGHEPEVARTRGGHEAWLGGARERVDDVRRIDRIGRQRAAERRRAAPRACVVRPDRTLGARRDVGARDR